MRALVTGISNTNPNFLRWSSSSSSAPSMTWLWNGPLVFDSLDHGGLICVWICLFNSFIGIWNECFCLSHDIGFVRFVQDQLPEGRTARDMYPSGPSSLWQKNRFCAGHKSQVMLRGIVRVFLTWHLGWSVMPDAARILHDLLYVSRINNERFYDVTRSGGTPEEWFEECS